MNNSEPIKRAWPAEKRLDATATKSSIFRIFFFFAIFEPPQTREPRISESTVCVLLSATYTMIINHDTRRFLQSRRPFPADFGYDGLRAFDTSFSVCLTTPFKYTGRDVLYRSRRFELWSPNSSQLPVYPGLPPANFNMVPPLQYPRVDGSGGRFDWTLNPQHFDTNRLHLPFITTPEHASVTSPYLASAEALLLGG